MADIDTLRIAKSNVIALLEEISRSPKPNYDIDGQEVLWADYFKMLTQQVEMFNTLIQREDDPLEFMSQMYT